MRGSTPLALVASIVRSISVADDKEVPSTLSNKELPPAVMFVALSRLEPKAIMDHALVIEPSIEPLLSCCLRKYCRARFAESLRSLVDTTTAVVGVGDAEGVGVGVGETEGEAVGVGDADTVGVGVAVGTAEAISTV